MAPLGPKDTIWYPIESGDYTPWKAQFDEKIKQYCKSSDSFEFGVSVKGNSPAKAFFSTFASEGGPDRIANALHNEAMGSYLGGKGGGITLMVFGVLIFIISLTLAFALQKCFRNKFRKLGNACNDRPRYHPRNLKSKKNLVMKITSVFGLLGMFALAVVCFVYAANLSYGIDSLACDFWMSMKGYFFGVEQVKTPEGVSRDWDGSSPQWKRMEELKRLTYPTPEDPTKKCVMCEAVEAQFSGEGGLVQTLRNSRDLISIESYKGSLLSTTFGAISTDIKYPDVKDGSVAQVNPKGDKMTPQLNYIVAQMLAKYAVDLDETTEHGVKMFRANIDNYLGRDSLMLASSYQTADTSAMSLGDVDFVMAKLIVMWDHTLSPIVFAALKAVLAITCILGIFALLFSLGGSAVFWKLNRHIKQETLPASKLTKFIGATYVVLLVFSGFSFLMSSILFFVGSAGSDACGFVDQVVFEEGRWQVFPKVLLAETVTNKTNIPTVLDTCVKETGTGDVAASLGLRMLLDKLGQSVAATETEMVALVDKQLDLSFKELKTHALAQMVKDDARVIFNHRPTVKSNINSNMNEIYITMPEGLDTVNYMDLPVPVSQLQLLEPLLHFKGMSDILTVLGKIGTAFTSLYTTTSNPSDAYKYLNKILNDARKADPNLALKGFCSEAFAAAGACEKGEGVYMFSGALQGDPKPTPAPTTPAPTTLAPTQAAAGVDVEAAALRSLLGEEFVDEASNELYAASDFVSNPFKDADVLAFLRKYPTADDANQLRYILQLIGALVHIDRISVAPLSLLKKTVVKSEFIVDYYKQLPGVFDHLVPTAAPTSTTTVRPQPKPTAFDVVQTLLPDITCRSFDNPEVRVVPDNANDWEMCVVGDALAAWVAASDVLAGKLIAAFDLANQNILHFVHDVTIGSFVKLLEGANHGLENFNGQFVGTSMKEGVVTGLCDVVMPSVVSLALAGIFLWFFSGIGAVVTWKIYHYYRDLTVCGETLDGGKLNALDEAGSPSGGDVVSKQVE